MANSTLQDSVRNTVNSINFVRSENGAGTDFMGRIDQVGRAALLVNYGTFVDGVLSIDTSEGRKLYRINQITHSDLDGDRAVKLVETSRDEGVTWKLWAGNDPKGDKITYAFALLAGENVIITLPDDFDDARYADKPGGWEGQMRALIYEKARWEYSNVKEGWQVAKAIRQATGEQKNRKGRNYRKDGGARQPF